MLCQGASGTARRTCQSGVRCGEPGACQVVVLHRPAPDSCGSLFVPPENIHHNMESADDARLFPIAMPSFCDDIFLGSRAPSIISPIRQITTPYPANGALTPPPPPPANHVEKSPH